jgi:predicted membrane metal-binding protein
MKFFIRNFYHINTPPVLLITLSLIIGIALQSYTSLFFIIFLSLLCYTGYAFIKHNNNSQQLLLCSLCMLIGAMLYQKELREYQNFYDVVAHKKCTLKGMIIDQSVATVNHQKTTVLSLKADDIATETSTHKSNKTILFYTKCNNCLSVGDTVTFFNICFKKPSSEDFQQYQIKEQILATLFIDNPNYRIDHHPRWSLRNWIWNQKKRLLDALENKFSSHCFDFFSSLFLGNRAYVKTSLEETNEQFKAWGIYHFLARSGLHLALFIFAWQALFCIIPLPLTIKQIIIVGLSCIYFALTWTSTPFTRSFALFALNKLCLFTKTPFYTLHYLTLICFLFLLYCPFYLFFLDFQLTFALTFALVWFNQVTVLHRGSQSKY